MDPLHLHQHDLQHVLPHDHPLTSPLQVIMTPLVHSLGGGYTASIPECSSATVVRPSLMNKLVIPSTPFVLQEPHTPPAMSLMPGRWCSFRQRAHLSGASPGKSSTEMSSSLYWSIAVAKASRQCWCEMSNTKKGNWTGVTRCGPLCGGWGPWGAYASCTGFQV